MKGKNRYIVPLLLAGVTATGAASGIVTNFTQNQNYTVTAAAEDITDINGGELKLPPFEKESYDIGEKIYLPIPEGMTADQVNYTITKGSIELTNYKDGEEVTEDDNHDPLPEYKVAGGLIYDAAYEYDKVNHLKGAYYFKAEHRGFYNLEVSIEQEGKITTTIDNVSVWVERDEATINLPVNSRYVIPAKIPTKQENFKIPAPSVSLDEDSDPIEAKDCGTKLVVKLRTPSNEEGLPLTLDSTSKDFYPVASTDLTEPGTYQIVYEYYNENNTLIAWLDSNFQVVEGYKYDDMKLTMTFLDNMPSSGNVNTDISVPRVKITESASSVDSINAEVVVTVQNVDKPSQTIKFNYKDYTFKPTEPGYYVVKYNAKIDLFGKEVGEITPGQWIEVEDNLAPEVIPTYAYELDASGEITKVNGHNVVAEAGKTKREVAEELLVNRVVDIPSVAVVGQEITIPAAYAKDNYYTFKGDGTEDIVIKRTYKQYTGGTSSVKEASNEEGKVTFTVAGDAEIRYTATDKENNSLGDIVYKVKVIENKDTELNKLKDGETKIKLNVGTDALSYREEKLEFSKPTVDDTHDKRVESRTWYAVYDKDDAKLAEIELKETTDDGKHEIITADLLEDYPTVSYLKIYTKAYLDKALAGKRDDSEVAGNSIIVTSKEHKVRVIKAGDDTDKPTFSLESASWNEALLNAKTKDKDGNDDVANKTKFANIKNKTVTNINNAGNAVDGSGEIKVEPDNDESKLVYAPFDQGDTVLALPTVKFTDSDGDLTTSVSIKNINGKNVTDVTLSREGTTSRSEKPVDGKYVYTISGYEFKLSYAGLYVVTFRAEDIVGNVSVKTFGIKVNDKTAPTIIIEDEDEFGKDIEVGDYFRVPTPSLVKDGETVDGEVDWEIYKTSGDAKYKISANGFTPLSEGTFFIRYSGQDLLENGAELEDSSFVVTAKDTEAPEFDQTPLKDLPNTKKWADDTTSIDINIPVLYADDIKTKKSVDVVCTVTTPNGTTIEPEKHKTDSNKLTFKASSQGIYTVKYYTIDDAGNDKTLTKTISVGDCVDPILAWKNEIDAKATLDKPFVLDINDLELSDNVTKYEDLRSKYMDVTLTGPDSNKVPLITGDGTGYSWNLEQTGKYTLKIVVKDKAGNASTLIKNIEVPEEEVETKTISPAVGVVLVVLSVVVLAGVVIYFLVSSKKKSVKTSKKSK